MMECWRKEGGVICAVWYVEQGVGVGGKRSEGERDGLGRGGREEFRGEME